MQFLLGILAGLVLPAQTSINTRLRKSVGTPFRASLGNFLVGFLFLVIVMFVIGDWHVNFGAMKGLPWWMFLGGACGATFIAGNVLLFPKLGGVQTVVFPVLGQILMGLLVDSFGWFRSTPIPFTIWRALGAALVLTGSILVALGGREHSEKGEESSQLKMWLYRFAGVCVGLVGPVQAAVNGRLAVELGSTIQSSVMNFFTGSILLLLIVLLQWPRSPKPSFKGPWWMYIGGLLGGVSLLCNVYLTQRIGAGTTILLILTGITAGGVIVDQFGVFESPKKPVNVLKIIGIVTMLVGVGFIRLI